MPLPLLFRENPCSRSGAQPRSSTEPAQFRPLQRGGGSQRNDAVIPMTIKLINEALGSQMDDGIRYCGQEVNNLALLGKISVIHDMSRDTTLFTCAALSCGRGAAVRLVQFTPLQNSPAPFPPRPPATCWMMAPAQRR